MWGRIHGVSLKQYTKWLEDPFEMKLIGLGEPHNILINGKKDLSNEDKTVWIHNFM